MVGVEVATFGTYNCSPTVTKVRSPRQFASCRSAISTRYSAASDSIVSPARTVCRTQPSGGPHSAGVLLIVGVLVVVGVLVMVAPAESMQRLMAVTQEVEKQRIRSLFSRFISPEMVNQLLDTQDITSLNKRTELTILFSDIRNFTSLSEQMLPEEVVGLLNPYLDVMSKIIHKHGGTVDKYEGDAIVAFFGEPIPHSDHALRAAYAALEMRIALKRLNRDWKENGIYTQTLEMGIGLNTGEVFVGLLGGSDFQFFYTQQSAYAFSPLWQAYAYSEEDLAVTEALANKTFATLEERRDLFASALESQFKYSYRVWVADGKAASPWRPGVTVSYDLSAGVDINTLWPYTLRLVGEEGGLIRMGEPDLFVDPANPIAGSNWTYDSVWQLPTSDYDAIPNPYTGLQLPQRLERAEVTVETGLPVGATYDWVTLEFAPLVYGHRPNFGARPGKPGRAGLDREEQHVDPSPARLGSYRTAIIIVIIFAIGSTIFSIVGPKILGRATTKLFEGVVSMIAGTGEGIDFEYIGNIILLTLGLYGVSTLFSFIQGWIMSKVAVDITYRFRRDISEKINRMPLNYFDKVSQGEVLSRITNDVDTVNQTLNQSLTQIITSTVTLIGVLVMMISISWQMTLVALLILPLSMAIISMIIKQSQKYFKQQQDYLGHINGHIEEMYGGHVVMKAFNGEKDSVEKFEKYNATLYSSAWKSQFLSSMMMPVMSFVGNLGYVAVSILGGWLAIRNMITVGDIQAFIQYVRSFTQPITQIANISNILQQTAAAAERVFEFLEEDEEVEDTETPIELDHVEGYVEFDHVRFGYFEDTVVIKDFSAKINPGQKVAIVGPTGAGKTTIVKLLMRFYDVNDGKIKVDGHNIKDFRRQDLRQKYGMVLQDTWLFNGSIMENIRYGRQDADDEEVYKAAEAAHVDHFVRTLPDGYQMVLNEETSNISQGQKQLLTIARAILADPDILILDEATSSVDTRTEVLIQEAMERLMENRTSFIIAHRLSTIRNADMILVLDEGDIVELGKHEELLEKGGFYADLYNSQFEYGMAGG